VIAQGGALWWNTLINKFSQNYLLEERGPKQKVGFLSGLAEGRCACSFAKQKKDIRVRLRIGKETRHTGGKTADCRSRRISKAGNPSARGLSQDASSKGRGKLKKMKEKKRGSCVGAQ